VQGGKWITDSVSLESIPVYIKEGSFIPTNNVAIANTSAYSTRDITVTYFPSESFSDYIMFDDDGTTNKSVEKKQFELLTFETDGWGAESKFTIRSNGGSFIGKPKSRKITFAIAGIDKHPTSVNINGKSLAAAGMKANGSWNEQTKTFNVTFSFTGNPLVITFKQ
jgi:oligosaccharide 4-alpha-D-glucosyltransferase